MAHEDMSIQYRDLKSQPSDMRLLLVPQDQGSRLTRNCYSITEGKPSNFRIKMVRSSQQRSWYLSISLIRKYCQKVVCLNFITITAEKIILALAGFEPKSSDKFTTIDKRLVYSLMANLADICPCNKVIAAFK